MNVDGIEWGFGGSATGCADYKPADGDDDGVTVTYSTDRQTAEVTCGQSRSTTSTSSWQLVCRDGQWTGYVDHCSSSPGTIPSFDMVSCS